MKFGNPLLTTELSGALGGVVGATARGGVGYFRRRVTGSNPNSTAQSVVRAIMAVLATAWVQTLTNANRAAWAAKAGPTESGIDVYTRANFQQLLNGTAASVATPPASIALDEVPITVSGTYDISTQEWTVSIPAGAAISYNVFASAPQNASRLARQFPFTLISGTDIASGSATVAFPSGTSLQSMTAGQVCYIRVVPFGDASPKLGRVGQEQIFRVTAVA